MNQILYVGLLSGSFLFSFLSAKSEGPLNNEARTNNEKSTLRTCTRIATRTGTYTKYCPSGLIISVPVSVTTSGTGETCLEADDIARMAADLAYADAYKKAGEAAQMCPPE